MSIFLKFSHNYNAVYEILAAVHSSSISRMHRTVDALSDNDRLTLDHLTQFCASAKNYKVCVDLSVYVYILSINHA